MDAQLGWSTMSYATTGISNVFMSKRLLINTLLLHYGCKLIAVTWLTSLFPCLYFKCDLLQTFPTIFRFSKGVHCIRSLERFMGVIETRLFVATPTNPGDHPGS